MIPRSLVGWLLVTGLCIPLVVRAAEQELPLAPAVECSPRGGLPNFLAKLNTKGAQVRIAYLGGSITAQEGWRSRTLAYFQKSYPDAKVSPINAAIGGTGSDLGVFRLKHDVLDQRPDLVFVEFAVNDGGQAPERIYRSMEGIVRQAWRAYPDCDICFVYTITDTLIPPLYDGKMQRSASAMERVADHYGIPSIHLGVEVAKLAREGKLILKAAKPKTEEEKARIGERIIFSPDGVHPYPETGHELYLQAIVRSLPKIQAASGKAGPHELKAPFTPDNYENAKMIPIDRATLSGGIVRLDPAKDVLAKRFGNRLPILYRADRPGEALTFKFTGRSAAIYDLLAPDAGQVVVTVDDRPPMVRSRFDSFTTYARLGVLPIASDLPDGTHTVRIEVAKEAPDKAKILAQRKEKMDDPKRFEGVAFYPGAILLVGDLVNE
ncbi:MAG TPA: GDSL-type esterase/lipase family protein [Tepidisphaeraceae bacterium]|jgi:lysophospholipase L1-like esterase